MPFVTDPTGRGLPTTVLARRGLLASLLLIVVIALLLMQYRGVFRSTFPVVARLTDVGDGIEPGADVKLRGALVGAVSSVGVVPVNGSDGLPEHQIEMDLKPDLAADIPAGVTARVVPTNVFGAPSVELVDPAVSSARMLARGAVILGDRSEGALQLQTVMDQLDKVLRAVHPAQLNVALTNISQGLQGRGTKIGSIIGRLDPYLTTLNGHTDDLTADLALLGTDLRGLADAAPDLLDTVDNAVVTSRTIAEKRQQLVDTLTDGVRTSDDVSRFLSDNDERIIRLIRNGSGIAHTLAPQRDLIWRSLISLGQGTKTLGSGLNMKAGGMLQLGFSLTPFEPYTAANCPRYPGLNGPNCGKAVPPLAQTSLTLPGPTPSPSVPSVPSVPSTAGDDSAKNDVPGLFPNVSPSSYQTPPAGGSVGPVGSAAEVRTIEALLGTPNAGAAGTLLLGPILRGSTVVLPA